MHRELSAAPVAAALVVAAACSFRDRAPKSSEALGMPVLRQLFFDDFSDPDLAARGWSVRSDPGGPGVEGARWEPTNVAFVPDPERTDSTLLELRASSDGSAAGTSQAELSTVARKFLDGTYAARIRFVNEPDGPGGDQLVEAFFTLGRPLSKPLDPAYAELDFEYVPNGGLGADGPTLLATSWDTYSEEFPPVERMETTHLAGTAEGWHTLVVQVSAQRIRYFLDARQVAEHGRAFYPTSEMAIVFNLWFAKDGLASGGGTRRYRLQVDWVAHVARRTLSAEQVERRVAILRSLALHFHDSIR